MNAKRYKRVLPAIAILIATPLWAQPLGYDGPESLMGDVTSRGVAYVGFEHWGGTWKDAEKSPTDYNDDYMCWAAAASNILDWTGWGQVAGLRNSDDMFGYFQDHWTDAGGQMRYGWDWWFDGTNDKQGVSGWSQVTVSGGGFYLGEDFFDDYREQDTDSLALPAIDEYLHAGYGVTLGVYGSGGHALTCWGYSYDSYDPDSYFGIWVTDSDDDKYDLFPEDELRYYDVQYSSGKWYLQDFYGSDSWYIGKVQALAPIPEPATLSILGLGGCLTLWHSRRNRRGTV